MEDPETSRRFGRQTRSQLTLKFPPDTESVPGQRKVLPFLSSLFRKLFEALIEVREYIAKGIRPDDTHGR